MPFETSCLVYSCCGLWISHKFCATAACSYPNDVLPTKSKQFFFLFAERPEHLESPKIVLHILGWSCALFHMLTAKAQRKSIITTFFLPSNIASVTLSGNCVFICSSPLCPTELKTFWGLNVQKVSVY